MKVRSAFYLVIRNNVPSLIWWICCFIVILVQQVLCWALKKSTIINRSLHIPLYQVLIETYLIGIKYIVRKTDLHYGLRNEED